VMFAGLGVFLIDGDATSATVTSRTQTLRILFHAHPLPKDPLED
jgi:hypothetical protein